MPRSDVLPITNIIIIKIAVKTYSNLTSKKDGTLLERAMTLLDVALPGELRSEVSIHSIHLHCQSKSTMMMMKVIERGGKTAQLDTPESSVKSGQGGGRGEKKRPSSPLARLPSESPKRLKSEGSWDVGGSGGSSTSKSTTHPQYLLLQLTQALMPFEDGKVHQSMSIISTTITVIFILFVLCRRLSATLLAASKL